MQPASQTVNAGDAMSMNIAYAGGQDGGMLTYFWDLTNNESFEVLSKVSSDPVLSTPYAVPANTGAYTATICDGLWTRRSDLALLTVNAVTFQITSQPAGGTYVEGATVTMSVSVTGGEAVPSYDWQFDNLGGGGFVSLGVNAPGIEIVNATTGNSGNYQCVITGVQGGAPAQLTTNSVSVVVNPVGEGGVEGEGAEEGAVEGAVEGEGTAEGAVEGAPEGEGCVLGTCPDFDTEGTGLYAALAALYSAEIAWTTSDIDGSLIPDSWEVALFQAVLCRAEAPPTDPTVCAYLANLAMLRTESLYGLLQSYEHVTAALLSISTEMQTIVKTIGLTGQYTVAMMAVKAAGEPFAAQGDPDGDGLDNLAEFTAVIGAGLGRAEYVIQALTPYSEEGEPEGTLEGQPEGEGVEEGSVEGQVEGEGAGEGVIEGQPEGEGVEEGVVEGQPEGEGVEEGVVEGQPEGEGVEEGVEEGVVEGQPEGEGVEEGVVEGQPEGEGVEEGVVEGQPEGEGAEEGVVEGQVEGEGEVEDGIHSADQDNDGRINLSELLRIIQFYNFGGYQCSPGTEDGYAPGQGNTSCPPHDSDYAPQDWQISLSELLRVIQFYNFGGYHYCPDQGTEDGYCPGL